MPMNEFNKVPNLSHEILREILTEMFYPKNNSDAELLFGYEQTWDYKSILYFMTENLIVKQKFICLLVKNNN